MGDEGYLVRFVVQNHLRADFQTPELTVFSSWYKSRIGGGEGMQLLKGNLCPAFGKMGRVENYSCICCFLAAFGSK